MNSGSRSGEPIQELPPAPRSRGRCGGFSWE